MDKILFQAPPRTLSSNEFKPKKVRAQVSEDDINTYMDNLSKAIKDVPPSRCLNYDETNLCDDPGSKKVICK